MIPIAASTFGFILLFSSLFDLLFLFVISIGRLKRNLPKVAGIKLYKHKIKSLDNPFIAKLIKEGLHQLN